MACQFQLVGTFPIKDGVPDIDILQAYQATQRTWAPDEQTCSIASGPSRVMHFYFKALASDVFVKAVVQTAQALARRFADWPKGVMRYTVTLDGKCSHYFYGPENRCIESKLSAIDKRVEDLHEEWTDLNYTQLAQASADCVELLDRGES